MERIVIAAVLALVAVAVAAVIQRRTRANAEPAPTGYSFPAVLRRSDFDRPDAPWLVAVFSSSTCLSCAGTWMKAEQLASDAIAVQDVEAKERKDLHDRYAIEAVPWVAIVDHDGNVRSSFLGEPTAADLWAAVAELREPGSTPDACDHHQSAAAG